MQKYISKHYHPLAQNDFIVFSDNLPPYAKSLLSSRGFNNIEIPITKEPSSVGDGNNVTWLPILLIYDKDNDSLRKRDIKLHIKSGDYFGTLATVIDLIRQEKEKVEERQNKVLKNLRDDLIYLQKNYKIIKKK